MSSKDLLKKVESRRTGDYYLTCKHPSGLDIFIYPKKDFLTTYAMFSTNYGSIDNCFRRSDESESVRVPDGIAHFLEHKLFENEDCDAFERYAETGASANAFTSFETTSYLFAASDNVIPSLEILLDFVQKPYFTEATVKKELGIIGQEIKMYDDDPNWRVFFNMLEGMYYNHPIKKDIAGSVESIAEITPELLYRCYNTFYNLNNMSLVICGNTDVDEIMNLCDRMLKPSEPVAVEKVFDPEPQTVVKSLCEEKMSVAIPIFQLGYKEDASGGLCDEKTLTETEILIDILASDSSRLFKRLYDEELVNEASFECEFFEGAGYQAVIFSGESRDPERVAAEIKEEIRRLKSEGISREDFDVAKKGLYGANIQGLNSSANIANAVTTLHFKGRDIFRYIDSFADVSLEDVEKRLSGMMDESRSVLSIIYPEDQE